MTNIGDAVRRPSRSGPRAGHAARRCRAQLDLDVEDVTPGPHAATASTRASSRRLSTVGLGDMAQGEAHRYRFTVSLPTDVDDSYPGRHERGHLPVVGHRRRRPDHAAVGGTAAAPGAAPAPARRRARHDGRGAAGGEGAGRLVRPSATLNVRARQKVQERHGGRHGHLPGRLPHHAERDGDRRRASALKLHASRARCARPGAPGCASSSPPRRGWRLAARRPVTVRLTMRAKVGTRVVTVRRTVRVTPASR